MRTWLQIGLVVGMLMPGVSMPQTTIRVNVGLVTVGVRVTDKKGRDVTGLTAKDFTLLDNDRPSDIAYFSSREQPVSLVILLDRSSSMMESHKIDRAREAALALVHASHPQTEFLYIPFNHIVPMVRGFTRDRHLIESEIQQTEAGGGTSLYDAIWEGVEWCSKASERRPTIVVISDGADEHSFHGRTPTLFRVRDSQVQVYTIGYYSPGEVWALRNAGEMIRTIDHRLVRNPKYVLQQFAQASGGVAYFPESDKDLMRAVENISSDVRMQYTLAFYPPSDAQPGEYRSIQVKVDRKNIKVRARPGYTYMPQE